MAAMPGPQAVILVDHGSRSPEAGAALEAFAAVVGERLGVRAYPAHMDLAPPTLAEAVARAVADGARDVTVCPLFLAPGKHLREDIPRLARDAARPHVGVTVRLADPLGLDAALAEVLERRVRAARSIGEAG